ncbi:hypothetical protein EYC84_007143 [Monilinia fructicola]|uniref:Uncharacterized protein n=1 Tax=Monilinia fructicola TaxID=38448 RepID=A0A5M9KDU6_MONFR|nr:hypothetical protein EYC84_007143 [Monilinia fructicola]
MKYSLHVGDCLWVKQMLVIRTNGPQWRSMMMVMMSFQRYRLSSHLFARSSPFSLSIPRVLRWAGTIDHKRYPSFSYSLLMSLRKDYRFFVGIVPVWSTMGGNDVRFYVFLFLFSGQVSGG